MEHWAQNPQFTHRTEIVALWQKITFYRSISMKIVPDTLAEDELAFCSSGSSLLFLDIV